MTKPQAVHLILHTELLKWYEYLGEGTIPRDWRVSEKISAMFLCAVSNRNLSGEFAPWAEGVDSSRLVIINSNIDLFLKAIGYSGPMTYAARRQFIQALARRVPLGESWDRLQRYNPRLVQQALYMFMNESHRWASERDRSYAAPLSCDDCPRALSRHCPRPKNLTSEAPNA